MCVHHVSIMPSPAHTAEFLLYDYTVVGLIAGVILRSSEQVEIRGHQIRAVW